MRSLMTAIAVTSGLVLAGCGETSTAPAAPAEPAPESTAMPSNVTVHPNKEAFFGDLHVHTNLSFDAFLFGTRRTPEDAYVFAKGGAIEHATGFVMQMKKPLDFQGVSDHAFYLGMMRALSDESSPLSEHRLAEVVQNATTPAGAAAAFQGVLGHMGQVLRGEIEDDLDNRVIARDAWEEIIAAAERHNDPGTFTTFVAYEYTSSGPASENLHRNVVFRDQPADLPFGRLDSLNPEDLWRWMDTQREAGIDAIAIPHNSNGSNGWMFERTYWRSDQPIDAAYADLRMRNEPLVENTQVKGTSDTHPMLSPNDEWANFEIMPIRVASVLPSDPPGSYVRDAYLRGLVMREAGGFNPYEFGVIGSSDTHNAAGSFEEDNYWSKTGILDINPKQRGSVPLDEPAADGSPYSSGASQFWGGSGLAAVWAESNTRESIFDAFRRKETFSTSGPHIKVRFFGSHDFPDDLGASNDTIAAAYANGVPMGGKLTRAEAPPEFFVWAMRDVDSGALQRLQIVKGWVDGGEPGEQVYDVACSDGGMVDPDTHRCPDNGATVDLATCEPTPGKGAAELSASWTDPDFDADQHAFYYARVLENPICRWSTWDAIRAGVTPREDMQATIQDRAWSSPIWYRPDE